MLDLLVDNILDIKPMSFNDLVVGLFALLVTTIFGTPLHVLSGYLVGLEVTRQTPFMQVGGSVICGAYERASPPRSRAMRSSMW